VRTRSPNFKLNKKSARNCYCRRSPPASSMATPPSDPLSRYQILASGRTRSVGVQTSDDSMHAAPADTRDAETQASVEAVLHLPGPTAPSLSAETSMLEASSRGYSEPWGAAPQYHGTMQPVLDVQVRRSSRLQPGEQTCASSAAAAQAASIA
jgi:hypothetical protein